jgi:EmrB/QacA subfamily drug resistance transporter
VGTHDFEAVPRRAWAVLAAVSVCSVMNPLSQSILNIAFPNLLRAFPDTSRATMSWVISIYAITSAATLVVGGVIADRFGRKRMLLIGCVGFNLASIGCGLAPNVSVLLSARVVQAIFGSLLTPAGAALVLNAFPASRRGTAISAWAASGSVATAVGPTLGALLVDQFGWKWSFWINVPFGIIGLLTVPRLVKEMPKTDAKVPDLVSVPIIMLSVSGIILGISQSARWGWADRRTIGSISIGVVLGGYLIFRSSRHSRPLLDLGLFRYRSLRIANISSLTFGTAFFALFFGFPQFTQKIWGYDVRHAGLLFLPIPIAGMILNGPAGKFAEVRGYRVVMITGGVLQFLGGVVMITSIHGHRSPGMWLVALTLVGLGSSLTWPAIFGNNVMGVPTSQFASVTSINQTAQRVATAAGTAVAVSLIGESTTPGSVGTFNRLFVLVAIGGLMAVAIGAAMAGAPSREREAAVTT